MFKIMSIQVVSSIVVLLLNAAIVVMYINNIGSDFIKDSISGTVKIIDSAITLFAFYVFISNYKIPFYNFDSLENEEDIQLVQKMEYNDIVSHLFFSCIFTGVLISLIIGVSA